MLDLEEYEGDNKIMSRIVDNPSMSGRIIRNQNNQFVKIKEERECKEEEKLIKEISCGIYAFDSKILNKYIMQIDNNNSQNEYYLPDVINIMMDNNHPVNIYVLDKKQHYELTNVNTREQLDKLNTNLSRK